MAFRTVLASTSATTAGATVAGAWIALASTGEGASLGFDVAPFLSMLSLVEAIVTVTNFDNTKFTGTFIFLILLLVPAVRAISNALARLRRTDDFAFVLATQCVQNLLFIYLCSADVGGYLGDDNGSYIWLVLGCTQATMSFMLFSRDVENAAQEGGLHYGDGYRNLEVSEERMWRCIGEIVRSVGLIVLAAFCVFASALCEGEEEAYRKSPEWMQEHLPGHIKDALFVWCIGEWTSRGDQMLENFREVRGSFLNHILLGSAALYPLAYFVWHCKIAIERFFIPFESVTACNSVGAVADMVIVLPFTAIVAAAVAYLISFLTMACDCMKVDDNLDEETPRLSQRLEPVAVRAYAIVQSCFIAPFVLFLVVKWETGNTARFDASWCDERPLGGNEVDWVKFVEPFNFTAIKEFAVSTVEDTPNRIFYAPWTLVFPSLLDLPRSTFFVACHASPKAWLESMTKIFSPLDASAFAQIRREYVKHRESDGTVTKAVDYECARPIDRVFCGSRCLRNTDLDELACEISHGQSHLSCACCAGEHAVRAAAPKPAPAEPAAAETEGAQRRLGGQQLDAGPAQVCSECCLDGAPRETGRFIDTLPEDDQFDEDWSRDKRHWEEASGPSDVWWWVNPLGLWLLYGLIILVTFTEITPVAHATTLLIFFAYRHGTYSKEITLLLQVVLALVADRRAGDLVALLIH